MAILQLIGFLLVFLLSFSIMAYEIKKSPRSVLLSRYTEIKKEIEMSSSDESRKIHLKNLENIMIAIRMFNTSGKGSNSKGYRFFNKQF